MQSETTIRVTNTPSTCCESLRVVVMAKPPIPGQVKTRLVGSLSPGQAAQCHQAMLECVLKRLASIWPHKSGNQLVLAMDAPPNWPTQGPWQWISQGSGDLGERIGRVWRAIGGGPAIFFGTDSPDLPARLIESVPQALGKAQVALGPVADGGYWTLAARTLQPTLLSGIDWGSDRVYHQSLTAAGQAGLEVAQLEPWHDVDTPKDLHDLRQRIAETHDPTLAELGQQLNRICNLEK